MNNFAWSFSRLKNFRSCPKKYYHVDIAKEYKDDSEQLRWGDEIHKALHKRLEKGTQLPATMKNYEDWPVAVENGSEGLKVLVENKLAMNESFQPCGFFDADVWFRGVVDVLVLGDKEAVTIDWKTGKIKPDYEQLALSAQLVFAHYPNIDTVKAVYVWFSHDKMTRETYRRDDMLSVWSNVMPMVREMAEAHRTLTYPPKPSGLCIHWCPVASCPFHGKGGRA